MPASAYQQQVSAAAIQALYESNRELAAIGRNVNQIAHALNAELQQRGELRTSVGLLDQLTNLKRKIDAHTHRVTDVFIESTSRWRDK